MQNPGPGTPGRRLKANGWYEKAGLSEPLPSLRAHARAVAADTKHELRADAQAWMASKRMRQ